MSVLANEIEKYIKQMLAASANNTVELQRTDLADIFTCVPSQINYVLSTRFANELGYHVESRRGGGGYIRIVKLTPQDDSSLLHRISVSMGNGISQQQAYSLLSRLVAEGLLSRREGKLIYSMLDANVLHLPLQEAELLRGRQMKNLLINLMRTDCEEE